MADISDEVMTIYREPSQVYTLRQTIPIYHIHGQRLTICDLFAGSTHGHQPVIKAYQKFCTHVDGNIIYYGVDRYVSTQKDTDSSGNLIISVQQDLMECPTTALEDSSVDIVHCHKPVFAREPSVYVDGECILPGDNPVDYGATQIGQEAYRILKKWGRLVLSLDDFFLTDGQLDYLGVTELITYLTEHFTLLAFKTWKICPLNLNQFKGMDQDQEIDPTTFSMLKIIPIYLVFEKT